MKLFRSGRHSVPSGSSSQVRLGCPAKLTPYISHVSRSFQLAAPNTPLTVGTLSPAGAHTRHATRLEEDDSKWLNV